MVRVDVAFAPRGVETGSFPAADGDGANGSFHSAEAGAEENLLWYCNEIEVMPSFYFDSPIVDAAAVEAGAVSGAGGGGGGGGGAAAAVSYQGHVAEVFGSWLRELVESDAAVPSSRLEM